MMAADPQHLSSKVKPNPVFLRNVTNYFIKVWPRTPASFFTPSRLIRKSYTAIQWNNVADALNDAPWMPTKVLISHDQISDPDVSNIADVAALITLLYRQLAWEPGPVFQANLAAPQEK